MIRHSYDRHSSELAGKASTCVIRASGLLVMADADSHYDWREIMIFYQGWGTLEDPRVALRIEYRVRRSSDYLSTQK